MSNKRQTEIAKFLKSFYKLWIKYPDLRFGQLIDLIWSQQRTESMFYVSDHTMLKAIKYLQSREELGDPNTLPLFSTNKRGKDNYE